MAYKSLTFVYLLQYSSRDVLVRCVFFCVMPFTFFSKTPYLSRKLLISILVVSSAVTLFLTGIQLYLNFNHEVSKIEEQLQQVEKGFLDSIAESVWDMDMRRLEIQLQGLKKLPAMHQFKVLNPSGEIIASVGNPPGKSK